VSDYPLAQLDAEFTEFKGQKNIGLMFRCPNCRAYASVYFKPVPAELDQKPAWEKTGDTLETLTLSPSVMMVGHFHSWIKNGQLCVDSPFSCSKNT
jgi:hypothetical protein